MLLPLTLLLASLSPLDEGGFQKLLTAHRGKVILYDFWATWCEPCRAELPQLIRLQAKLKARGFELITISADEPEQVADAEKLLKKSGAPLPAFRKQALNDDKFINAIDPKWSGALPALFLYLFGCPQQTDERRNTTAHYCIAGTKIFIGMMNNGCPHIGM